MTISQFIGGQLVSGGSTQSIDVINPATGQAIGEVNAASAEDIDVAVAAARQAFEGGEWQERGLHDRANVLWQFAERLSQQAPELAELEVRDAGMPLQLATMMIESGISTVRY